MFFIIFITLMSYHSINYNSDSETHSPRVRATTRPNSPEQANSPNQRLLIPFNQSNNYITTGVVVVEMPYGTYSNANQTRQFIDPALNIPFYNNNIDLGENPAHKVFLKCVCGCILLLGTVGGIVAAVNH